MAIARKQAVSANANNVAISSTAANDVIIVFAYNNASTTIPTLAGGYTNLSTNSATGNACRIAWKLSAGGDTTSGSWTNATNVACHVYSGTNTTTPFLNTTVGAGNSATLTFTGFTMTNTDGSDWIVGFGGAKACTSGINGNTAVLVNQTNQTIITGKDTNGGVTSYSSNTLGVTGSGRWLTMTVEIDRGPQVTNSDLFGSLSFAGTGNEFIQLAPKTGSLSFIGNLSSGKMFSKLLTAALSFSGAVIRSVFNTGTASVSFSGSASKRDANTISGALSFTGAQTKSISHLLSGTLSFVGTIRNAIAKWIASAISFIGDLTTFHSGGGPTAYSREVSGALTFYGAVNKSGQKIFVSSQLFSSKIVVSCSLIFSGVFSFVGSFSKNITQDVASAIGFLGNLSSFIPREVAKILESTLEFRGYLVRRIPTIIRIPVTSTINVIKIVFKNVVRFIRD